MKVLFVSSGNSHYGIIPFVKSQGESLKKEGVTLEYFTVKGKGLLGYVNSLRPLRNYLKHNKFDVIHAHYGLIGLLCVVSLTRTPIVLSVMGDDAYGDFDIKGRRIKSSYLGMFLTQIALIFVDQVIVKSKNILKAIPHKKKSQIVANGVNFEIFKPNNDTLKRNKILFLADVTIERKNYKLLEDAMKILNDDRVEVINPYPIKHSDFPKYLNDSSVFVLTSYNEGSPNVIKEAMACNIPVVSTNVGDVEDVISNTAGCYLTSFDAEELAEKLKLALAFGKRTTGREDIKHLEASVVAKKLISIYNKTIKN